MPEMLIEPSLVRELLLLIVTAGVVLPTVIEPPLSMVTSPALAVETAVLVPPEMVSSARANWGRIARHRGASATAATRVLRIRSPFDTPEGVRTNAARAAVVGPQDFAGVALSTEVVQSGVDCVRLPDIRRFVSMLRHICDE
jgi:hypothetical protein